MAGVHDRVDERRQLLYEWPLYDLRSWVSDVRVRDRSQDRRAASLDDVEKDFWAALEFRICVEFAGFQDKGLRSHWCDGLIPEEYDLRADEPCIRGTAFCGPSGQERWRFTLLVEPGATAPAEIDWTSLLPADDVTGWLSPRRRERALIIDPHSAHPD
jgi:hypothetical protein